MNVDAPIDGVLNFRGPHDSIKGLSENIKISEETLNMSTVSRVVL